MASPYDHLSVGEVDDHFEVDDKLELGNIFDFGLPEGVRLVSMPKIKLKLISKFAA